MAKRYILFRADGHLAEEDLRELATALASKGWKAKVIPVEDDTRWVIVRTDGETASQIRAQGGRIVTGRGPLVSLLSSGAVGKLKRRAREAGEDGQVHE